eukprot:5587301-Amphidinium_carterae.3
MKKPGTNHPLTTKSPTNGCPDGLQLQAVDMKPPKLERKHHPPAPPRRYQRVPRPSSRINYSLRVKPDITSPM